MRGAEWLTGAAGVILTHRQFLDVRDSYLTPAAGARAEIPSIRGSRFIGDAMPVDGEAAAGAFIERLRGREKGATHHCWAWRLGPDGAHARTSDDGEPSGTAGAPILRQIEARDLTDLVVVVTRYFGGTKLGTGGLVRAYGRTAAAVLDAATIVETFQCVPVRVQFGYDDTTAAMTTLHHFEAEIVEREYAAETTLIVSVRKSRADDLVAALTHALAGCGDVRRADV